MNTRADAYPGRHAGLPLQGVRTYGITFRRGAPMCAPDLILKHTRADTRVCPYRG
ncbi:MAG: hypothetical protein ACM3SY_11240 [Candidatus Omnitrophota bacterium]